MPSEPIKRNRYSEPPFTEGNFSARNFDEDFNEFHLPLNRMQLANFQEWGVAQGLEVSGSIGGTTLTIAPGVAVDIQGQLISLSTEGKGDIGSNPPSEEHQEVDVPVILDLSSFAPTEDKTYFLTIQFSQILRFEEGPLGRYEDAPWIRLQSVDDFVADGNSLVLATVTINSNGELTELQSKGRRLASKTVQELSLRRPQLLDEQVQQVDAGKIASTVNGLEITLPNTVDELLLSQKDGDNFTQLTVNADNSNFRGNINATQNLQVEGAIAASSLTVNGNSNLNQNLQVEGALAVNDNANIQGNLTVSGNLEVQGDVTAKDVEHVSGNVSFGDADNDEVKITGVLHSGHSSGALQIDDALKITGSLTVDKNLDVKGDIRAGNSDLYFTKIDHIHTGIGNTAGYAAIENSSSHDALMILGRAGTSKSRYVKLWDYLQVNGSMDITGNLGIGTTSPGAKLHIVHANQNANGNSLIIGPTNQSNLRLGYDREYSWIQSHGSKPLAINSVGNNVGIGTTNPRTKLEVVGTIKATKIEGEGAVVAGMIMMWSGQVNNIPNGWALCDGRNGTPDLRDRFIVGVGRKYGVGNQGGFDTVTLNANQIPNHSHSASSSSSGNHIHAMKFDTGGGGNFGGGNMPKTRDPLQTSVLANFVANTNSAGNHNHTVRIGSTGGNQAHENRPPFYALALIIKL